ncbi:hypothetical protein LCGC14_1964390 [marine sediment metagenome]|uniref:C2H2-type domain-containing protein n=1 Tax=marine sediment metagenome TaxID=412755 RepID=A0A0F9FDZ3_9ZZZZ
MSSTGQWRCTVCGYMNRNEDDFVDHMADEHAEWVDDQ